jgi:hypothetical protein
MTKGLILLRDEPIRVIPFYSMRGQTVRDAASRHHSLRIQFSVSQTFAEICLDWHRLNQHTPSAYVLLSHCAVYSG